MSCHIDSEDKYKSYVIEFVKESLNDFPYERLEDNEQEFIEYIKESANIDKLVNNHPQIICQYTNNKNIHVDIQDTVDNALTKMAYECFWTDAYEIAKDIEALTNDLLINRRA